MMGASLEDSSCPWATRRVPQLHLMLIDIDKLDRAGCIMTIQIMDDGQTS